MDIKSTLLAFCLFQTLVVRSWKCNRTIPHGTLLSGLCIPDLEVVEYKRCGYLCDKGYRHNKENSWISCSRSGQLSPIGNTLVRLNIYSLCQKIYCPHEIPHGSVPFTSTCTRASNTNCRDFTCNKGYMKHWDGYTITCNLTGHWEWYKYQEWPCKRLPCPQILNGVYSCYKPEPGYRCDFYCNEGYVKQANTDYITCGNDSKWIGDADTLCVTPDSTVPKVEELSKSTLFGVVFGVLAMGACVLVGVWVVFYRQRRKGTAEKG